jgi:hypothetical protein
MNTLNSLYFPGTTIYSISQYPLFLLFPQIDLLSPAESNIHGEEPQTTDSFIEAGLCRPHTPYPLGKDLKRFTHLINDIKNRKDDYASQLSTLTLAAMSDPAGSKESSSQEILSSLLGTETLSTKERDEKQTLQLWQARLFLAIGEIVDHEKEEISLQLAVAKYEEAEVFRELQGKADGQPDSKLIEKLASIRDTIIPAGQDNTKKRLQAWKQIYREDDIPETSLLLTDNRDAADLILESFDQNSGQTAVYLGQLSLPAAIGMKTKDVLSTVNNFRRDYIDILDTFTDILVEFKACGKLEEQNTIDLSFSHSWEELLQTQFPAEKFGRTPLSIYSFSGTSCSSLLNEGRGESSRSNGLMAVMGTAIDPE